MISIRRDPFFLGTALFWLVAAVIVAVFTKAEIHLYLNQFHTPFFDWVFRNITWLGDGIIVVSLALILAFVKVRYGLFVLTTYLTSGIFVQLMKRVFFSHVKRPRGFFEGVAELYFVPGVDVHTTKSFPSGHTTTAFAFFACLALLIPNRYVKFTMFVLALLTGYSRVYISQHFLVDVFVGSMIGTLTTYFLAPMFLSSEKRWMEFSPYHKWVRK